VGKGGAGKSVIAGTLARALARRGETVLALDSDLMPGLALSLGASAPPMPPLLDAAERREDGRWRLRKGIGPVRAIERYATAAPDGVRLLQCGKATEEGTKPIMGAVNAFYQVIHRLPAARSLSGWQMVGDLPAGPRQAAFDWAPYADTYLVVVEPTWKSVLTARRLARLARARGAVVVPVASKVGDETAVARIEAMLGERVPAAVPADPAVSEAERLGLAPIDAAPEAPAVRAVAALAERLVERRIEGA
jgi:CO dehydrogenase maturation factor